ncbi:uncharacterized protein TNCV_3723171 [Trichonephila clavipes]|nr:uncharacterized protein TNCV_3723171 [Trichonephila clavipes]
MQSACQKRRNEDHAPASFTTCRIIMSESSDYMELSPSKFDQVSAARNLEILGSQVKVEGYLVRGITQCFNCNNFYHTAANCFMKPRCLKCGKDHATRNCHIKERQENPFVSTARTSVTRHVILNVPNSQPKKRRCLFRPGLKEKFFKQMD